MMSRNLFRLNPLCRRFASLATSNPSSTRAEQASCGRLDIVRIDHDFERRGMMRLYSLLDGAATSASVVNLGSWCDRDLHMESGPLNSVKGLTGSLFSVEAGSEKRRILLFDPVTRKTLSFLKPLPPNVTCWTEGIQKPIYVGRYNQRSLSAAPATTMFKVVELYGTARREGMAIGCDICTLANGGGCGAAGRNKRVERRSVEVGAGDLNLGKQTLSLDDCFHGDNILCWGVCRDDNDSWSIRQSLYKKMLSSKNYYTKFPDALPKVPTRVGSDLVSVLSLDLITETLKITPLPPSILQRPNGCNMHLCNLEDRPSICLLPKSDERIDNLEIWTLKEGSFDIMALGDPSSWCLRCAIPANHLPCGYLGPVALRDDKLFLLHEWVEVGCAQRRLVYYCLRSEELCRVVLDNGEDVTMDARSDVLVYEDTLAPIWPGTSVQLTGMARARMKENEIAKMYGKQKKQCRTTII